MAIVPITTTVALYDRRGLAVAAAAALVYGALAAAFILAWDRLVSWGRDHPELDASCFGLFVFFGLAFIPSLPIAVCLALALAAAAFAIGLSRALRARDGRRVDAR